MFQGAVLLGPQDLSITTRTEVAEAEGQRPSVTGQAVGGTEYSAGGTRQIESTMKGAGGDVSGYLGVATLPELMLGDLSFHDVRVSVLTEMPEFGGHHPEGIVGIDLLSQAAVASVSYSGPGEHGHLRLSEESNVSTTDALEIPFSRVLDHILVRGTVDGAPVDFVFDTGARRTHLHPDPAEAAHLVLRADDDPEGGRGLDGTRIETRLASARILRLGDASFSDVTFVVADLQVFHTMGLGNDAGLLGNTFLDRFSEVEVDFQRDRVRLVP